LYKGFTEEEINRFSEGRERLYLSAKNSYFRLSTERYQWINDEDIIKLAKSYNLEDELEYIANCVWGDL